MTFEVGDTIRLNALGKEQNPARYNQWADKTGKLMSKYGACEGAWWVKIDGDDITLWERWMEIVTEFKVGDRVRVKDDAFQYASWANGKTGRIVKISRSVHEIVLDEKAGGISVLSSDIDLEPEFKAGQTVRISFSPPAPVEGEITLVSDDWIKVNDRQWWLGEGSALNIEILSEPLPEIPAGCKGVLIDNKYFYHYRPEHSKDFPFQGYDLKFWKHNTIEFLVGS